MLCALFFKHFFWVVKHVGITQMERHAAEALTESLGDMWLSAELNSATSSSATSL